MMKINDSVWEYIKNYKFNSIFIKNLLFIILLVELPLIGVGATVYSYYFKITKKELSSANLSSMNKIRDMTDIIFLEAEKLSLRLASDIYIDEFLSDTTNDPTSFEFIEKVQRISQIILTSNIISDYVDSIYIYSESKDYIISTSKGNGNRDKFFDDTWYYEFKLNSNKQNWIVPQKVKTEISQNNLYNVISNYRTIPVYRANKSGVVIVNIDTGKLKNLINSNSDQFENIYIYDKNGLILYNINESEIGTNVYRIFNEELLKQEEETSYKIISNDSPSKDDVIILTKSKFNQWMYAAIMPIWKFEGKLNYIKNTLTAMIIISCIIAVLFAFVISVKVFSPIKNIIQILKSLEDTDGINVLENQGFNELRFIKNNIINSYNKKKEMELELTERVTVLKKATNIALQAQISPHFLYNTLENIQWKAMMLTKGPNEASEMISYLSKLLRISLETKEQLIPLKMEIDHARLYVEIQKIRYDDRFTIEWQIDDNLLEYKVVKIMLQPIIENAIYHGIKPKIGSSTIWVSVCDGGKHINICVSDDGEGIVEADLEKINKDLQYDYIKENDHIGLKNVNQRIKLCFGDDYGLLVEKNEGGGTKVNIVLPKVY